MVRMAVVNPDEIEVFLSHIVVDPEDLKRIDLVSSRPVLRRDIPGPAGFHHAPRSARMADEKTTAFLRIRLAGMILNRLKNRGRDLDRHGASQYRSPSEFAPASGKTVAITPSRIRSARRQAAS